MKIVNNCDIKLLHEKLRAQIQHPSIVLKMLNFEQHCATTSVVECESG